MFNITIKDIIIFLIISIATWGIWVLLELLYYGAIQTRVVDNYIGFIMNASLFMNYKLINKIKNESIK